MSEKVGEHTSIPVVNIVGSSRPDKRGTDVDRIVEVLAALFCLYNSHLHLMCIQLSVQHSQYDHVQ